VHLILVCLALLAGCSQQPQPAAARAAQKKPAVTPPKPELPKPEPPKRLENPPAIVKGVYLTSWSAGLKRRIDYVIALAEKTGINAVVIDIKDYSGYLTYRMAVPDAQKYGAFRVTVRDIDAVINKLHAANLYCIARITVFQDPILAAARPDLAVHRKSLLKNAKPSKDTLWLDRKGLAWIDPAAKPSWDYVAAVGRDALSHGFDELNFDYIRFPSDGNLRDMHFPIWDEKIPKPEMIRTFFAALRQKLPGVPISADMFGLATVNADDLGIGQVIEDAYLNFDAVCPMVYPSHYAKGFRNFPKPSAHPYEVVKYSMEKAVARLRALRPRQGGKLRPWLQDFDLGSNYDAEKVRAQITATKEALGEDYAGYLMWSPSNVYTAEGLKEEVVISAR
jgi:hypothetical protein